MSIHVDVIERIKELQELKRIGQLQKEQEKQAKIAEFNQQCQRLLDVVIAAGVNPEDCQTVEFGDHKDPTVGFSVMGCRCYLKIFPSRQGEVSFGIEGQARMESFNWIGSNDRQKLTPESLKEVILQHVAEACIKSGKADELIASTLQLLDTVTDGLDQATTDIGYMHPTEGWTKSNPGQIN